MQPVVDCCQNSWNHNQPVQGSIARQMHRYCPQKQPRCIFSQNLPTCSFMDTVNAVLFGLPMLLPNGVKENSIYFELFEALPSAPEKSNKRSLSSFELYVSYTSSCDWWKSAIVATAVSHDCGTSWSPVVGRLRWVFDVHG